MTDDRLRDAWRDWALGQSVPSDRLDAAVDAALRVVAAQGAADAAAAAARLAGGVAWPGDAELLRRHVARADVVVEEVGALTPGGSLTPEAAASVAGVFGARREAMRDALRAAASPDLAPRPVAPPARREVPAPPAPGVRELLGEHSIVLLSTLGAFLLIVATVLYELYAIGALSGELRFSGVLGLDLVFGAAGWACLLSARMRLVGHIYVAVAALLAPLVLAAAYVFVFSQRGLGLDVAVLLAGGSLTALYGLLAVRLRQPAYGALALTALPVAWLGGVHAAVPGEWSGPAVAALVAVYASALAAARRLPGLGEWFALAASPFPYGAALVAAGTTLWTADPLGWPGVETLALTGAGLLLAWSLARVPGSAHAALVALGLAWVDGAHALGLQGWTAPAAVLVAPALLLLGRARTPLSAAARHLAYPAAAGALLLTGGLWFDGWPHGERTAWWPPAALGLAAATGVLDRLLNGRPLALLAAATMTSLTVLAGSAALDGGAVAAALELLALAIGWALAAERAADPTLATGLRAGAVVQALLPVLVLTGPARITATVLLGSAAVLVATAVRTRTPVLLLLACGVVAIDWYWLGLALLPPQPPSTSALAVLYSPLPALLGVAGLAIRAGLGRRWAWPLYASGAALVPLVAALAGMDTGLVGRELLAAAAVAYAVAAVERWTPAAAGAVLSGGLGLALALHGAGAPAPWTVVALSALASAVYAGHVAWRDRRLDWRDAHRLLGLAGAAAAAVAMFTLGDATHHGGGAALAIVSVLAFAGLLVAEARLGALPLLDHAAVVAASPASAFVAWQLSAGDPQWFVAVPGLALVAVGLAMPRDPRLAGNGLAVTAATGAVAAGAALLLGTTAVQAFVDQGWGHTAWLVAEAVACVLVGIATRSRALVVLGAAAVGTGGLRALFTLVEQGLLFVAFGVAAVFLLGLGAALAALRGRARGRGLSRTDPPSASV